MTTIEDLERRIRKLERRVAIQDEIIDRNLKSFVRVIDIMLERNRDYCRQRKEDESFLPKRLGPR
jgi:uncharacterized coiled-coil protein SlyX